MIFSDISSLVWKDKKLLLGENISRMCLSDCLGRAGGGEGDVREGERGRRQLVLGGEGPTLVYSLLLPPSH